jgi:lantibiotic modifying enzyme
VDWILKRATLMDAPPSLYSGLAGVAVFLLHAGLTNEAVNVLNLASEAARNFEIPGLYDGAAGWGLANLHFWLSTDKREYLSEAVHAGEHLLRSVKLLDGNAAWESNQKFPAGLGYGPSGIGLFLLYLYLAQGNPEYLAMAKEAVLSDISAGVWLDERVYHHDYHQAAPAVPKSPHMRHGSGGVGTAALRLYAVTGEEPFRSFGQSCADTVSSRYTNKLWQDWGLAGFGELLLDAARFLNDEKYLQNAHYVAEGILAYRIFKDEGIAFPGSELMKISCDFGLGSAGIGTFLHRLLNPGSNRFLLLDELIGRRSKTELRNAVEEHMGLPFPARR